ncbi:acyltransferase [Mesonia sp. MT50]|uniref:Acyltransferase n=1 Tax=Mesonia profundi TaxID=3070998 RepID=A0ABU1A3J2_9FLAO|nr:acyltransferase [Mesonia profundi]MDQ7918277.1 acyltransferase [Mesonia profundi]
MKTKLSILYSWFIRLITIWMPNHPVFRRFRGWLYSFMMEEYHGDFEVSSSVVITVLSGLKVGKGVRISHNVVIIGNDISLEDEVIIGPNTVISGSNHQFDGYSFRNAPGITLGPVVIKRGSWIGANCSILSGSILPKYSVLAAGAVLGAILTEERLIYGGVPAKRIGKVKKTF